MTAETQTDSSVPWNVRPWEKYRLEKQKLQRRAEGNAPISYPQLLKKADAKPPALVEPLKLGRLSLGEIGIIALSVIGLVSLAALFVSASGWRTTFWLALVALLPLLVIVWLFMRVDKWAPLPRRFLIFAFLWGAGISTIYAMVLNSALSLDATYYTGSEKLATVIAAAIVAPVTEETCKGLGVAIILLLARRFVVSALNGAAIAGITAGGFAFIENIQYFSNSLAEGTSMLGLTIFMRAVMSPFVHPLATVFTGIFVAMAILKNGRWWAWTWRLAIGFGCAMATHCFWNATATLTYFYPIYFFIALPAFIVWLICLTTASTRQGKKINVGLTSYVASGWISNLELQMVCLASTRRQARKHTRQFGPTARRALRTFLVEAGRLGLDQKRIANKGPDQRRMENDRIFLAELLEARQTLISEQQKFVKLT